jgi:hypothetical protein
VVAPYGFADFAFFTPYNELGKVVFGKRRCFMVARGRVQDGVVVLDEGVRLPEGLEVMVLAPDKAATLSRGQGSHSVLDIPTFSVGKVLKPLTSDDDLLGEMLEGRNI